MSLARVYTHSVCSTRPIRAILGSATALVYKQPRKLLTHPVVAWASRFDAAAGFVMPGGDAP